MTAPEPHNHDEYLDYSCSTNVERLAREVETLLRSWHINQSDRHVSAQKHNLMIRRDQLVWQLSFHTVAHEKLSCTVDLELVLWDGPPRKASASAEPFDEVLHDEENDLQALPMALRRPQHASMLPLDVTSNFSHLFGIGQHISLFPLNVELPKYVQTYLATNVLIRHDRALASVTLQALLSQWLQAALNMAASASQCALPLFGIWGSYQPQIFRRQTATVQSTRFMPRWACHVTTDLPDDRAIKQKTKVRMGNWKRTLNRSYLPPIINGKLLGADFQSTFSCSVLRASPILPMAHLSTWANMLLEHCADDRVELWNARHVFQWTRRTTRNFLEQDDFWRRSVSDSNLKLMDLSAEDILLTDDLHAYRRQCQLYVLSLIDEAAHTDLEGPYWGPADDPLACLQATVTWSSSTDVSGHEHALLQLPLKIRSRRSLSNDDLKEAQEAVERAALDLHQPGHFSLQAFYDHESPHTPLAATLRCVLAALIRTATLPAETMLTHLQDESLIDRWDSHAGNLVAQGLAEQAGTSTATCALVEAMDWTHVSDDMIEPWRADDIVNQVLDGNIMLNVPSPPESALTELLRTGSDSQPLLRAAPPGRLVSLLFLHLARVRLPCSMSMVWTRFVSELRRRWDVRESLPNMNYIPGIDPAPGPSRAKRCFSMIGIKANFAAQVNSSEPDPDDFNCLIGQKLQLFNLCLETVVMAEIDQVEEVERSFNKDETDFRSVDEGTFEVASSAPASSANSMGTAASDEVKELSSLKGRRVLMNGFIVDGMPKIEHADKSGLSVRSVRSVRFGDDAKSYMTRSTFKSQQFFDADEGASVFFASVGKPEEIKDDGLWDKRSGVRCPVYDQYLKANGAQVYAPYLQRPYPLTDDAIAQRRIMLWKHGAAGKASDTVNQRLEIVHRLQKPKLMSDMSAFKAANPGCIFEDFIAWYGNPSNPLEEYDQLQGLRLGMALSQPTSTKLDRAAEAIKVLRITRDFWQKTWDNAKPSPAFEHPPLFDPFARAEMAFDYLETLHPAGLLCQVMAANIGLAYFALKNSAKDASQLSIVQKSFNHLRERIDTALELLALDATTRTGALLQSRLAQASTIASVETISCCERVCAAVGEMEVLLSRALSLLRKMPGQVDLVENILSNPEGSEFEISEPQSQKAIYRAVAKQQSEYMEAITPSSDPLPAGREYVLRNFDDSAPCQLCVRYAGTGEGGLVLATTKCVREVEYVQKAVSSRMEFHIM